MFLASKVIPKEIIIRIKQIHGQPKRATSLTRINQVVDIVDQFVLIRLSQLQNLMLPNPRERSKFLIVKEYSLDLGLHSRCIKGSEAPAILA